MKCVTLFAFLALFAGASVASAKDPLTADQKTFLSHYGAVHVALAADDLPAAKQAAAKFTGAPASDASNVKKIAEADSLEAARTAFKALSKSAVTLAAGQPGFYHVHCPMVPNQEGDWIQPTKKVANPYFGKSMLTCGVIEG